MYIFDADSANEVVRENKAYQVWEKEQKNKILGMVDSVKKQAAWRQLFPEVTHDDSFLAGNIF